MTHEIVNWLDQIKNQIITLEDELNKNEEVKNLTTKNLELTDEIANLNKVSLVAGLTRQLDEKNQKISILEQQLETYKRKSNNKLTSKLIEEDTEESSNELEGYEFIDYEDLKLLKDIETKKLYFLDSNGKGRIYAGKESKKRKKLNLKIKLIRKIPFIF